MRILRNIGKWMLRLGVLLLITLLLFEVAYRYQWVDFYRAEWRYQNDKINTKGKQKILVFGDSFSAEPNSWVNQLRKDSTKTIFNASISGVGPETYRLIFSQRLKETYPDVVIVQLYVGNDLYDIRKPVNWSKFSFSRNLFWTFSNKFRVLNFINYRFGQFSVEDHLGMNPKKEESFQIDKYAARTKLYIQGDANYPSNQIFRDQELSKVFDDLQNMLLEMKEKCGEKVDFKVLIIPHCTEVSQKYVDHFKKIGAHFKSHSYEPISWGNYLLYHKLEIIDPRKALEKMELKGEEMYFQNDPHLNINGQMVVKEYVQNALK